MVIAGSQYLTAFGSAAIGATVALFLFGFLIGVTVRGMLTDAAARVFVAVGMTVLAGAALAMWGITDPAAYVLVLAFGLAALALAVRAANEAQFTPRPQITRPSPALPEAPPVDVMRKSLAELRAESGAVQQVEVPVWTARPVPVEVVVLPEPEPEPLPVAVYEIATRTDSWRVDGREWEEDIPVDPNPTKEHRLPRIGKRVER